MPELVEAWERNFFASEGFVLSAPARSVLLTLGGLSFEQAGPGETCARRGFLFDPTMALGESDRFQDFEAVLGVGLCPLGEDEDGDLYLAIGEDGRVISLMDNGWIIGTSIEEGLNSLVLGRRGELVCVE